ncbi:TetR/AcrR family transcriptional regulator [Novosphingobium sp. 9]|uniref:TetR/AcrR family transcriptional regulator n=1 Tax=Novosphingobium sp. 9 TaxID=2025349 RepID=UPI0021B6B711|nr:TetR/AcrR family transcriptional regulator [Novosphingobium sp. 9]
MPHFKDNPAPSPRGEPLRQRVLDAAEALLRSGKADFSMRDLAAEAGVSFATPFNQFGNKAAIMHALSARRIDAMAERFAQAERPVQALDRVLLATATAAQVMLEEPQVNRAVMEWIGTAAPSPGNVLERSSELWRLAIAQDAGKTSATADEDNLPRLLAFGFRGVLSFWTAGELADDALVEHAQDVARAIMAGAARR